MASYEVEADFVACYWAATESERDDDAHAATEVAGRVPPDALEDADLSRTYGYLADRYAAGQPTHTEDTFDALREAGVSTGAIGEVVARKMSAAELGHYAAVVVRDHQRRRFSDLLERSRTYLANGKGRDGGKRLAEELALKALSLYADSDAGGVPQTKSDILAEERRLLTAEEEIGITLPWPKLDRACGPWVPGDVVGVSAFSNAGKSTFAANLAFLLARRQTPFIVFPTEMRQRWVARGLCALSGVPQKVAEKRQWKRAKAEEIEAYNDMIDIVSPWPWTVVNVPNISPAEILSRTRILRRNFAGRPVVVIVDHMHRLDYGGEDPNDAVGPATKMFKDFAGSDKDGVVFVLLFQPRKPDAGGNTYRPIAGHQIRGNSMVWNELDVHLSPFRTWVRCSEDVGRTAWNTPKTLVDPNGAPVLSKPNKDGAKLADEHYFLKVDKDRVGGEGPIVVLNFDKPSGCIHELAHLTGAA